MNKSTSALKLISCLAGISLAGLGIFALDLTFGHESLTAFAVTASALLLLGVIRDYSPRRARWEPARRTPATRFPTRHHVVRRRASALVTAA